MCGFNCLHEILGPNEKKMQIEVYGLYMVNYMKVSVKKRQPPYTVRIKVLKHFGNYYSFHKTYW